MNNLEKAMDFLVSNNLEKPIDKSINVYGWEKDGTYKYRLIASVNRYLNESLDIIESLVGEGSGNRPGIMKSSTEYITVHDTGSAFSTATAKAHDQYVRSGGNGTSWHYTVGNDGIFHQIPNQEVAFHAGDGSRQYHMNDTSVKGAKEKPAVSISTDGFYELNGMKTTVLAPANDENRKLKTENLTDSGLRVTVGDNGNWFIGDTWYSKVYGKISNTGGNRNSIGIESCINRGSDLYLTWQRLAKLVAYLMETEHLGLDCVVQHNFFSGKDCPQTMRHAQMWDHFLELVKTEYTVRTMFSDLNISYIPKSPFIAANGRIVDQPKEASWEQYIIHIENKNGCVLEKTVSVLIPCKKA